MKSPVLGTSTDVYGKSGLLPADSQQTPKPPQAGQPMVPSLPERGTGGPKQYVVIFTRYSNPTLQNADSSEAQEKLVRHTFDRKGIDHTHALVLCEQGVRGDLESESREAFDKLLQMIRRRKVKVLGTDQQSRFSRGCNVEEMITDLVYYNGRFVTSDGTDTQAEGWQMLVGIKGIQSRAELRDIGHRVRRQQVAIADQVEGCVGDQPYGFGSEYQDPVAAAQYRGRGPKPRKRIVIDAPAAAVVRLIFILFTLRCWSISKIVRHLNAKGTRVPAIPSKRWHGWHYMHVHRILSNPKYIGIWRFGDTTTVRSGCGKKKQVPAKDAQQIVTTQRQHLRLIPQATWEKALENLAQLKKVYGQREGQLRRGTPVHYTELYPSSLLGGLIYCPICQQRMHLGGNGQKKHFYCPVHRKGLCTMGSLVRLDLAEQAVLGVLAKLLASYPPWVAVAMEQMLATLASARQQVPEELTALQTRLAGLEQEQGNLLKCIRKGVDSEAVMQDLKRCEADIATLKSDVATASTSLEQVVEVPGEAWVREKLGDLATLLNSQMPKAAQVLRPMLGKIVAEPVIMPGKKRGFVQLRLTIQGSQVIAAAMADRLPAILRRAMATGSNGSAGQEFVLELGKPTNMDRHGATVVAMRQAGAKWSQIATATGLKIQNAYTLYKRLTTASSGAQVAPPEEPPAAA